MRRPPLWAPALALLLAACASRLEPAPWASIVPGPGGGAAGSAAGVTVIARAGAWRGYPRALGLDLTPVLVTIDNEGATPIRLRTDQFALVTAGGQRLAAIPPFEIQGTALEDVSASPLLGPGPPPFAPYPYWHRWGGPFGWDDWYWGPAYVRVPLPTGDMVQKALPETVVEPHGRAAGFLYFPLITRKTGDVEFTATLVDARTAKVLGTVAIPFVVR